eukprot:7606485-Prorocentrum_lima.AAC.1
MQAGPQQTARDGEDWAIVQSARQGAKPKLIMVDCLGTVQAQRGQPEHQFHADWWAEVRRSRGQEPALTKVKAHITEGQ